MKKVLCLALAVVLTLSLFAGCAQGAPASQPGGQAGANNAAQGGKTKVSMATQKWNESGTGDFLRIKSQEFVEMYPQYEFEEIYYETGQLVTQMLLAIAAGTPPDVIEWGHSKVGTVIASGDVEAVNDYVDASLLERIDRGDFGTEKMHAAPLKKDGKYYGIMYQQASCQLMCNTKMFDEAGIALPNNYAEFVAACLKLTDAPNQFGYAFCTQETATRIYEQFCFWACGFDENFLADGDINVNTPKVIEAMAEWKKLFDANVTPIGVAKNAYRSMFGQGTVAMIIDGPWVYASAESEEDNVAEYIHVVPSRFPTGISTGGGSAVIIPKASKNKEGAGKYLDLILSKENQTLWCEMTRSLCGDNTAAEAFVSGTPWFAGYSEAGAKGKIVDVNPANHPDFYEEIEKIVTNYVQDIFFNDKDPAVAMAECQAELNALLDL